MKDVVVYVTACHRYSERQACALTRQARSTQRKPHWMRVTKPL